MKLMNLGNALKFATDKEAHLIGIYEEAAGKLIDTEAKEVLLSVAAVSKKRSAVLERLYKENMYSDMDTGIFEPLAGLNDTDYMIEDKPSHEGDFSSILQLAIETEETIERFYRDLAAQLKSRRSGVARELERAARENSDKKLKLKSFQSKLSPK